MGGFTDGMDLCRNCGRLREYGQLHNNVCRDRSECIKAKEQRKLRDRLSEAEGDRQ